MTKIRTVHDLEFDKQNFNKGNEQGKALIKKSISEHGTGRSILVDKNAKIIAGNKTTENFKELGFEKVKIVKAMPDELVVVQRDDIDLDTPQGRAMALADNKTSEANLEWDFEMMQEELPTEMLEDWGMNEGYNIVDIETEDAFSLPEGDKAPFQQQTYTLADAQAIDIKNAIADVKKTDDYKHMETFGNENSNGNALYLITSQWAEQRKY